MRFNSLSNCVMLMLQLQNGGHDIISCRKVLCCHLVGENETSTAHRCSSDRQLLIYSTTFVLVGGTARHS